jgi:5'(3')-deoxyribonucleotidase
MAKKVPTIDFNPFEGFYLDLDGVFADFEGRVFKLSGKHPHELGKGLWKIVMADKQFFGSLEFMPDAEHLWTYTKQFNPIFLTGAPPGERSRMQKVEWVAKKFGPEHTTIVLPKKDKQLHSGPNKVLIDDTHSNVNEWAAKGGHSIFHKGNVWETIELVEELRRSYKV